MYSIWINMLFATLMLTSIFNDIQASFPIETISDDALPEQTEAPSFERSSSTTASNTSGLCAGMNVHKCAEEYGEEIKQCKVCGLISTHGLGRAIINGQPVKPPYKYPWMVALIKNNEKVCGAALISDRYVLTAAHCITVRPEDLPSESGKDVFFRPSDISVAFLTKTHHVERGPPVEKIIPHPEFTRKTMRYDVALLKLKEKITCGEFRNPICLPSPDQNIDMKAVLYVTGWGTKVGERPHDFPETLMEGTARIINFSDCKKRMHYNLEDISYCLKGRHGKGGQSRPCYGDSGGPTFYNHEKKIYVMGVASLHTCVKCSSDKPFVFASVPKVVRWIEKIAGPRIQP